MADGSKPRVLVLNAGSPLASTIARSYADDGWTVSLEILADDLPDNDLVVEIWDAGGHIDVLDGTACPGMDASVRSSGRHGFDRVVDALEAGDAPAGFQPRGKGSTSLAG